MGRTSMLRWLTGMAILGSWFRTAGAAVTETHPYAGVTYIVRTETTPRPVTMHIIEIDLDAPGLRFVVTPHAGPMDTYKQTTLDFLHDQGAQVAINAHFFEPWPPPSPDPLTADLVGLAASNGDVYSPFESAPPKPYAIQANAPGLNLDASNQAMIVHRDLADPSGFRVVEQVTLHNTVAGNEQIVTDSVDTVPDDNWNRDAYNARTAIGLSTDRRTLFLFTVDKAAGSQGLSVFEVAEILRADPYHVRDALALDGGGSSTLVMEDPRTHTDTTLNVPVSGLRAVGSNLAVFGLAPGTGVRAPSETARLKAFIAPPYPNPFRSSTTAEFRLPRRERVEARIVDIAGRTIRDLASGVSSGGRHRLVWDGTDERGAPAPSGCYVLVVVHEDGVMTRKLAIVR